MIYIIFFILQVFQVLPQNIAEVSEMSMKKPVLIYFLIYGCPDCQPYFPIWKKIVAEYDKSDNFVLAEANCRTHRVLRRIFGITWVPSFVTVYQNQTNLEQVESTIESMKKVITKIEKLYQSSVANFNNTVINESDEPKDSNEVSIDSDKCKKITTQILNYPSFVIGSLFQDPCQKVLKYQQQYPHYKNNFYYTDSNKTKGYIALRPDKQILFENNIYSDDFDNFIHEFTFQNAGDWELRETYNISRRIAFFIYQFEDEVMSYKSLMQYYDSYILFGKIDFKKFKSLFPSVYINSRMLPSLAISNLKKTSFTILNSKRGYNRVIRTILAGRGEKLMKHSLKPVYPNVKSETTMFFGLLIMSITVVFTTGFVIWLRAKKCINMYNKSRISGNTFL